MNGPNAQYLFEDICSDVVRYLVERNGLSPKEASATFHNSETFSRLEDPETSLYIESRHTCTICRRASFAWANSGNKPR